MNGPWRLALVALVAAAAGCGGVAKDIRCAGEHGEDARLAGCNEPVSRNQGHNPVNQRVTLTVQRGAGGTVVFTDVTCSSSASSAATCTGTYGYGLHVPIRATPDFGSAVSWTGCDYVSGTHGTTCNVKLDGSRTVSATFRPAPH